MSEQEIIDNWLDMKQQQPIQLATQDAYWQHYRIQAAIAAMQGLISGGIYSSSTTLKLAQKRGQGGVEFITQMATEFADALVEELKKGGQDEQE